MYKHQSSKCCGCLYKVIWSNNSLCYTINNGVHVYKNEKWFCILWLILYIDTCLSGFLFPDPQSVTHGGGCFGVDSVLAYSSSSSVNLCLNIASSSASRSSVQRPNISFENIWWLSTSSVWLKKGVIFVYKWNQVNACNITTIIAKKVWQECKQKKNRKKETVSLELNMFN